MNTTSENTEIVKRIQKILLEIICDIDDYCKENNIVYFLSGGTCLGAVRHQGFIPWDDDGDIMMHREDYESFIKSFAKKYRNKYTVGSLKTDKSWQRPWTRICDKNSRIVSKNYKEQPMGIFVDVFPIDALPDNKTAQFLHYKKMKFYDVMRTTSVRSNKSNRSLQMLTKDLISIFTSKIGARYFAIKMDKLAQRNKRNDTKEVAVSVVTHYGSRETISREEMSSPVLLSFENALLPVPNGYKTYLSNLYCDYMTIPKDAETNGYTHLDGWEIEIFN